MYLSGWVFFFLFLKNKSMVLDTWWAFSGHLLLEVYLCSTSLPPVILFPIFSVFNWMLDFLDCLCNFLFSSFVNLFYFLGDFFDFIFKLFYWRFYFSCHILKFLLAFILFLLLKKNFFNILFLFHEYSIFSSKIVCLTFSSISCHFQLQVFDGAPTAVCFIL